MERACPSRAGETHEKTEQKGEQGGAETDPEHHGQEDDGKEQEHVHFVRPLQSTQVGGGFRPPPITLSLKRAARLIYVRSTVKQPRRCKSRLQRTAYTACSASLTNSWRRYWPFRERSAAFIARPGV